MPKSENQKIKLLLLKEYLEQNTDENHPASTAELLGYLEQRGIHAERKSLYRDIQCLEDFGCDVIRTGGKHAGYAIGAGRFDLAELKLLADAVLASKFLTEKKSAQLIQKLGALTSRHQAGALRRSMVVSGRVKSMNESVIYNVDDIHQAILANSQISFRYFEWNRERERVYRKGVRTASPYALCWDDSNYYLIAHTEEHGITHFRVDKMAQIKQTGTPRIQTEETKKLDLSRYSKEVFGMFSGEPVTVRMRFENSLAGVVIDRFGKEIMLIPDGADHFVCMAEVRVSPVFYSWIAGFGARARLLSPQSVVDGFRENCREILKLYEQD
ncbi:MAG: WYL domain-containing protein [Oscillospiraceae bacterium]|nr:WYL domain-containing protein [Oscillospiraceae bacterium]